MSTSAGAHVTADLGPGDAVGRYRMLEVVGEGGMGRVFKAQDCQSGRLVAIKLPRPQIDLAQCRARLAREARMLARISHPSVVALVAWGESGGCPYLVVEHVAGRTLRRWHDERLESSGCSRPFELLLQAGRALAAVHAAGVVHRDFKPSNVLVGCDGRIRLVDFGISRCVSDTGSDSSEPPFGLGDPSSLLTAEGEVSGTLPYMAPEQQVGRVTDARADQFAFCVVAWELLFGVHPLRGLSATDRLAAIRAGAFMKPERHLAVHEAAVETVLRRGLTMRPSRRHGDMSKLVAALERAARAHVQRDAQGDPRRTRSIGMFLRSCAASLPPC